MIHETVVVLSLLLMGVVLAAFAYVAINASSTPQEYAPIQTRSYALRAKFFWLLVVGSVVITAITTVDLPFAATRGDLTGIDRTVDVKGGQWYWQLDQKQAVSGETVVFNVQALDVTHGLGVYDPEMRLICQTQAMPGYTNALKLTFKEPGKYKLLCMEYCGLAHHAMISEFIVTP